MRVTEILEPEYLKLADELRGKVDTEETEMKFMSLMQLAEQQGSFDRKVYVFSSDENYLYDMLNFSIGLSALWREFKKDEPKADILSVNQCIVQFMINMWGLEKVSIPVEHLENRTEEGESLNV